MTGATARQDRVKYLFIWPAFLVVLVISLFPLIYALTVSFQTVRIVPPTPPRFVGLDNYAEIATSARFWGSIWTTALITFISVVLPVRARLRAGAGAAPQRAGIVALPGRRSCCRCSSRPWASR